MEQNSWESLLKRVLLSNLLRTLFSSPLTLEFFGWWRIHEPRSNIDPSLFHLCKSRTNSLSRGFYFKIYSTWSKNWAILPKVYSQISENSWISTFLTSSLNDCHGSVKIKNFQPICERLTCLIHSWQNLNLKIWKLKKRKRKGRGFKRALKRYKIVEVLVIVNPVGANGGRSVHG